MTDQVPHADFPAPTGHILAIGPLPPPYNGMSVASAYLLGMSDRDGLAFYHLDTADTRGLANVGRLDLVNVVLAIRHGVRFVRLLLAVRPDVVYVPIAQNALGSLRDALFLVPARLAGKAVVVHLHGSYFAEFYRRSSRPMRALLRYTLQNAVVGIVLGESLRSQFAGLLPLERVRSVPNGIPDFAEDGPLTEHREAGLNVLFLSFLSREKGVLTVIETAARVHRVADDIIFRLVGEWSDSATRLAAHELIARYRLEDTVHVLPPAGPEAKQRRLLESDVMLFPSANEGHPFVIVEAMCAGLPVLTTRRGAIPEMFDDGTGGWQLPVPDAAVFAERLLQLRADADLRSRMGRANRERYLELLTLSRWEDDMRGVFEEALRAQRTGWRMPRRGDVR